MVWQRLGLVAAVVVAATSSARAESPIEFRRACEGPGIRCGARIAMRDGRPLIIDPSNPPIDIGNLAPVDIQAAYHIDPTAGSGVTIAIVDAYSYKALESDLAMYRTHFDLPACTIANSPVTKHRLCLH